MKRFFLLLAGAMTLCWVSAQTLPKGQSALVYYTPKNIVVLDFEYSVETREVGTYAKFAEELLGISDVVKENATKYVLEQVNIARRTEVDLSRPHTIIAENGVPTQLISINDKGLLVGYNCPGATDTKNSEKPSERSKWERKSAGRLNSAPIPEEVLEAKGLKAQAEALAKQIFRIRETRMYLLSGEVDHAPADGTAMKCVLAELDAQEHELTALFVGKKSVRKEHKEVTFCPIRDAGNIYADTLFFSAENGFTYAENIDADAIYVRAKYQRPTVAEPTLSKADKKKVAEVSPIVYNTPGHANISVIYKGKELGQRSMPIAQLGADVPLAKELFTGSQLPVIVFSDKTGNIVSISK